MTTQKLLLIILLSLVEVNAIWPPSYKINLSQEETFVISEELSSDDVSDIYEEDEMIKEKELKGFRLEEDFGKFSRLHQLTLRRNSENAQKNRAFYNKKPLKKPVEVSYEDTQPWEGGFVEKNETLKLESKRVHDHSDLVKQQTEFKKNQERREASQKDENYDYSALKAEYYSNIKSAKISNETMNYTEIVEEESFKDAVKAIIGKNKPRNCTVEERKGIGMAAAECFWSDLSKPGITKKERSGIFRRIATIIFIWLLVYLLVAVPCWCQKGNLGWCCCCFQCKFCKPRERIDVAKKYLLDNPPGIFHSSNNEKHTYQPTSYEQYAQKKLEKALLKL